MREQKRRKLKAYGRWDSGYVPAEPVREHVLMLQAAGMGLKRIAEVAGVGNTAVSQLIYGRTGAKDDPRTGEVLKRVARAKAEKLLAVQPGTDQLAGGARVPALGTHRRLQALVACGWSLSRIAVKLGMDPTNMAPLMSRESVTLRTAREVAELYEELWNCRPTASTRFEQAGITRAIRFASARRWVPPLGWDDIDTDEEPPVADDEAFIDEVAVELAASGERVRLTSAERREVVRVLHARKLSDADIARRAGLTARTVLRIRDELGLPAVMDASRRIVA